jgi:hypothetical protein
MTMLRPDFKDQIEGALPFEAYQVLDVTFTEPDADVRIPHTLVTDDPERVVYLVLDQTGSGTLYRGALVRTRSDIVLRSSRAPSTVRLLLALLKPRSLG